jgi:hypothetical protein
MRNYNDAIQSCSIPLFPHISIDMYHVVDCFYFSLFVLSSCLYYYVEIYYFSVLMLMWLTGMYCMKDCIGQTFGLISCNVTRHVRS